MRSPGSAVDGARSVVFMADTGARPSEAIAVEWRHVDLDAATVELPGVKTDLAWRTVHLTKRGVAAIRAVPRTLTTRRVFNVEGRPISWPYFWREVWKAALDAAGLEYRPPEQPAPQLRPSLPPSRRPARDARSADGPRGRESHLRNLRRLGARDGGGC